jgi:integrase/recombinase XerD
MSSLNDCLVDYLRIRRQLGFELKRAGRELTGFVAFLEQAGAERITSELALRWACQPGASERYHSLRLGMVRGFARYLATLDPQSEIPPADLLAGRVKRITPYLYCEREITELMAAAGALMPALRGATYRTVIGLLAVTGIRIGEALALDREDVSLDDGMLRLRVAKQHKQRLVPLHEKATNALVEYARARDDACPRPATAAFFLSANGTRICGTVFDRTFRTLTRQSNRSQAPDRRTAERMTSGTRLRCRSCCAGIKPASTSSARCRCSRPTSGTSIRTRPTGICTLPRS